MRCLLLMAGALGIYGALPGCRTPEGTDSWVKENGPKLDRVQQWVEEYGTVSMGTPILSLPDERFAFELDRSAQQYYADAKAQVQGGAASFEQRLQSLGISLSAQYDPTQVAAHTDHLQQVLVHRQAQERRATLLNRAARLEYEAAMRAAAEEEDPQAQLEQQAAALRAYGEALQPGREVVPLPTAPTDGSDVPAPANVPREGLATANALFAADKFAAAGGLLEGSDPTISNRAAIAIAAGDRVMSSLFSMLSKPDKNLTPKDTRAVFGVTMISVNPGWRTSEGFVADISMQVELGFRPARLEVVKAFAAREEVPAELRMAVLRDMGYAKATWASSLSKVADLDYQNVAWEHAYGGTRLVDADTYWTDRSCHQTLADFVEKGGFAPSASLASVTALSPMTDGQTLDLAGSSRRRTEFTLSLAAAFRAAGQGAQAGMFQNFARQLENDAVTRSNQVTVNAYSSGSIFGFKISPAFEALTDPREKRPTGGYRLRSNAFPALINMSIKKENLDLALLLSPSTAKAVLAEPVMRFVQIPQWHPWERGDRRHRLSITERLEGASILHQVQVALQTNTGAGAKQVAKYQISGLQNSFSGAFETQPLPLEFLFPSESKIAPEAPVVDRIEPATITLKLDEQGKPIAKTIELILLGKRLDETDLAKVAPISAGASMRGTPVVKGDGALVVQVRIAQADTSLVLSLPSAKGAAAGLAVVPVAAPASAPPPRPAADSKVVFRSGEAERSVTISAGAPNEATAAAASIIGADLRPSPKQD